MDRSRAGAVLRAVGEDEVAAQSAGLNLTAVKVSAMTAGGFIAGVVFIQGFLVEGLRFLGDWRNLLFGALIVLAMNVRPGGLLDANSAADLRRALRRLRSGAALGDAAPAIRRRLAKWRDAFGA